MRTTAANASTRGTHARHLRRLWCTLVCSQLLLASASPGGQTSMGGVYRLEAKPRNPTSLGGGFSLSGSAKSVLLIPLAGGPTLHLRRSGDALKLSWTDSGKGFRLEAASELSGNWQPLVLTPVVTGNEITVTVAIEARTRFLRLVSSGKP